MIKTASWFAQLPPGHVRIGISRGIPRDQRDEDIMTSKALSPGRWFKSVLPQEYQRLYGAQLAELDPAIVVARLQQLAGPSNIPVLACFENAADIAAGRCWCHRHLVARWLEQQLGIEVEEIGWPKLDRFRFLTDPQPWPKPRPKRRASPNKAKPKKPVQPDLF